MNIMFFLVLFEKLQLRATPQVQTYLTVEKHMTCYHGKGHNGSGLGWANQMVPRMSCWVKL